MRPSLCLLVFAALAAAPASAQSADQWTSIEGPFTLCELHEDHEIRAHARELIASAEAKQFAKSATFDITYTNFTAQQRTAFQFAADIWATHISGTIPIKVNASFEPLAPGQLGGANAARIWQPGGVPNTWYGSPLADQIFGQDLCSRFPASCATGDADITARFASNFSNWYFGTDGNPGGRFDFVSVVLHEIAHGLGFFGSLTRDDGSGARECNGAAGTFCHSFLGFTNPPNVPVIYDRFVEDAAGNQIINTNLYPNPSTSSGPLGMLAVSGDLFWDSPTLRAVNGNQRAGIFAPAPWNAGSSFSHWDNGQIVAGSPDDLMTPQIGPGQSYQSPGRATCALLQDIGWELGEGCLALVVDDEDGPEVARLGLDAAGPNPFREATAFRLSVPEPQAVRATLHDALGREVSVLYDGTASAPVTLRIAGDLAPGVYTVLVEAEAGRVAAPLVRVR
ncbi:MAG: hypothetical protein AAGI52_16850 [Bacteroidota bacterium]